jgi:hypothetical protein
MVARNANARRVARMRRLAGVPRAAETACSPRKGEVHELRRLMPANPTPAA